MHSACLRIKMALSTIASRETRKTKSAPTMDCVTRRLVHASVFQVVAGTNMAVGVPSHDIALPLRQAEPFSDQPVTSGSDGYGGQGERGDCGHAIVPITTCPSSSEQHGVCSGHGWCGDATKRCTCEEGYTGGDCSLRTCKKGLSWFDYPSADNMAHLDKVECSNAGSCSRSLGECTCQPGFFGAACEFFGCVNENYEYSQVSFGDYPVSSFANTNSLFPTSQRRIALVTDAVIQ